MNGRNRFHWWINILLVLTVSCNQITQAIPPELAGENRVGGGEKVQVDGVKDLDGLMLAIPDDPAEAAQTFVRLLHGADESYARVAAEELLRRSGIPLVTFDGKIKGLPDGEVLRDAPVYIELIPRLTESVRAGDYFTAAQLSEILFIAGIGLEEAFPAEVIISALGLWGKEEDVSTEIRFASAAIRGLSGYKGQVLYAGADPEEIEFDFLQSILILAHITSSVWLRDEKTPSSLTRIDRWLGVRAAHAQAGPCDDLVEWLSEPKDSNNDGQDFKELMVESLKELIKKRFLDIVKLNAMEELKSTSYIIDGKVLNSEGIDEFIGEKVGKFEKLFTIQERVNQVADVLGAIFLILGMKIEIEADKSIVHFHHSRDHSPSHVKLTAKVSYDLGDYNRYISCFSLAGIELPSKGLLSDFTVRWKVQQPPIRKAGYKVGVKYLVPVSRDVNKVNPGGSGGEKTGADGQSTIELYTPEEEKPGVGSELSGTAWVIASVDKNEMPFKLADLVGLVAGRMDFAASKAFEIILEMAKRAAMPNAKFPVMVEYHGKDIYIAQGMMNIFMFYYDVPIGIDVWTCEGLDGQWHGYGGYALEPSMLDPVLRPAFKNVFGKELPPPGYSSSKELRFNINPHQTSWIYIHTDFDLTGVFKFFKVPEEGEDVNGIVGEVELKIAGESFASLKEFGGKPFVVPIRGVDEYERCPGGNSRWRNE